MSTIQTVQILSPQKTVLLCFDNRFPLSSPPPLSPQKLLFFLGAGLDPDPDPTYPLAELTSYEDGFRFDARYGPGAALCGLCTGAGGYAVTAYPCGGGCKLPGG